MSNYTELLDGVCTNLENGLGLVNSGNKSVTDMGRDTLPSFLLLSYLSSRTEFTGRVLVNTSCVEQYERELLSTLPTFMSQSSSEKEHAKARKSLHKILTKLASEIDLDEELITRLLVILIAVDATGLRLSSAILTNFMVLQLQGG